MSYWFITDLAKIRGNWFYWLYRERVNSKFESQEIIRDFYHTNYLVQAVLRSMIRLTAMSDIVKVCPFVIDQFYFRVEKCTDLKRTFLRDSIQT